MGGLDWYISSFFLVSTNAWLTHFSKNASCLFTLKQFWSLLVTPSFSLIPLSPLCLLTFDTYNPQPTFSTFVDIVVYFIFGMYSSTWCHVYSLKSLRLTNMHLTWFPESKYPIYLETLHGFKEVLSMTPNLPFIFEYHLLSSPSTILFFSFSFSFTFQPNFTCISSPTFLFFFPS